MNGGNDHRVTFAVLDKARGIELPPATSEEFPLPAWYRAVREVPLEELTVEDICKACRQGIHLEHVVPIALRFLQTNPLAGEMYDGEILVSLKSIPPNYWVNQPDELKAAKSITEQVLQFGKITDDLRQDVVEFKTKLP